MKKTTTTTSMREILMWHVNIISAKSSMIDDSRDNSIVSNHRLMMITQVLVVTDIDEDEDENKVNYLQC